MKIKDLISSHVSRADILKAWSLWQKGAFKKLGYGKNVFTFTLKGYSQAKFTLDDDQYLLIDKAVTMLKEISKDDYELLVDYYVKGMSYKQIAEIKGFPAVVFYRYLDNAQSHFYQNLLELI